MPAFSLTPINSFPQTDGTEFPNPLAFSQDDTLFVGPITLVNFIGGTVTEDGMGTLNVTLGGGGSTSPGSPLSSFQWNNAGAFGGTIGLSWTAELGSTSAQIVFSDLLIDPPATLSIRPKYIESFLDLIDRGQQFMTCYTIGTRIFSTVSYVPDALNLATLDQPGLWIGGSNDNATPSNQCYDAWFLPYAMSFAQRNNQATFTKFLPMVRSGVAIAVPAETFNDGIQVIVDGNPYWIPLIAA